MINVLKHLFSFLLLGFLIYISGFILFVFLMPTAGGSYKNAPKHIVIFTGSSGRTAEGLKILKDNPDSKLLISGVNPATTKKQLVNAANLEDDVPYSHIVLDFEAQDTHGNAVETAKWARENSVREIMLVTSNYHMARSKLELARQAPELEVKPHPVVSEDFKGNKWIRNQESVGKVFYEYNKLIWAWARHRLNDLGVEI